ENGVIWWYGTPDAPAPEGIVLAGSEVRVRIGVEFSDGSRKIDVFVIYWVNRGRRTERIAHPVVGTGTRLYEASLGSFWPGEVVSYAVKAQVKGQGGPKWNEPPNFASSFRVESQHAVMSSIGSIADHEKLIAGGRAPGIAVSIRGGPEGETR